MKRTMLVSFVVCMLAFGASGGQAAVMELSDLPATIAPNVAGSFTFDVELTDKGSLSNIDFFNFGIQVTGASGLGMPKASVLGPTLAQYIFSGNTFAFTAVNPGGDLSELGAGDLTSNGLGVNPSPGHDLLALITLNYPALPGGTDLIFSLIPSSNFAGSSDGATEDMILAGDTEIEVVGPNAIPEPGVIWLLVTGVVGLVGVRRKFLKH